MLDLRTGIGFDHDETTSEQHKMMRLAWLAACSCNVMRKRRAVSMAARDSEHVNISQCCGGGGQNDRKGQLHARLVMLCQHSGGRALGGEP